MLMLPQVQRRVPLHLRLLQDGGVVERYFLHARLRLRPPAGLGCELCQQPLWQLGVLQPLLSCSQRSRPCQALQIKTQSQSASVVLRHHLRSCQRRRQGWQVHLARL